MCLSKPKTPKIQPVNESATPPEPLPVAETLADPKKASTELKKKRTGLAALRLGTATNVPSSGSGVNA